MEKLTTTLRTGNPWPLGSHWDGHGVNFAVFSDHAEAIELCLFDTEGVLETGHVLLPARTGNVWHGYLPQAEPGLVYGLRAYGPWNPGKGQRFNAHKLLLDPYARALVGNFVWREEHVAAQRSTPEVMDTRDNATHALKARVVDEAYDWDDDKPPTVPQADTVLYELHVKGFSQRNPAVPEALRGSYAGLAHEASITHLKQLGVTSLSLLPVHYALDEERLVSMGLTNYWGYNSIAFFAPASRLASGHGGLSPRDEFRAMVKTLHAQGLEVLLDVVYNHTAESDHTGPTLSFRGLDNASYYRLRADDLSLYENHTGCGNTLDLRHPRVLQLVLDSLRFWITDMHVDGFRFDLAPVLGRGDHGFDRNAAFFAAIAQDPVLSRVKLIAEPWDIGPKGYQLGQFPSGWLEWNDRFRDTMRGFWLPQGRHTHSRGEFALRLCGSADLFQQRHRMPVETVNYVISHDGFTLHDLVSYNHRHNHANGENNHDGTSNNMSNNCGAEGPTHDVAIATLRARLQRALMASTVLAQGTPMLCAGDEMGHSQHGNNNPYCQDNTTTWIDWSRTDTKLLAFTTKLLRLRRQLKPLGSQWYTGSSDTTGRTDLGWFQSQGEAMHGAAWNAPGGGTLGCLIGKAGGTQQWLLLLVNPQTTDRHFVLPPGSWRALLDTSQSETDAEWTGDTAFPLSAHSLVLLIAES